MAGFALGLGCDCCDGTPCRSRINVVMSDAQSMLDSGVTVTVTIKLGSTTVATHGPDSPDASSIQYNDVLTAGETYTVELLVEQDGGPDCTFTRTLTTPDPCPGSPRLVFYIPRLWFRFPTCHSSAHSCDPAYPCDMAVSVAGPGGFTYAGNTGPAATVYDPNACYVRFTPCAEGEYTATGTSTVPGTNDPTLSITLDAAAVSTSTAFWIPLSGSAGDALVHPDIGLTWPGLCEAPIGSLSLSSTVYGSGTITPAPGGDCDGSLTGETTGTLPDCAGGTAGVGVSWSLNFTSRYDYSSNQTTWIARLTGVVTGICLCRVPDGYGVCRWTAVAGGTHAVSLYGEAIIATTAGRDVLCFDCETLDLSFAVGPVGAGDIPICDGEDTGEPCALPANLSNLFGDVLVTV